MLNCDFKGCRFKSYYPPIFFFNNWRLQKKKLKKRLLKKKKKIMNFNLAKYNSSQDISSFFFFSFRFSRMRLLRRFIRHFRVHMYYDYVSYISNLYYVYKPLYIIWNLKRNQLFVNFLNPSRETIKSISCGFVLNILKQHGKSNRRKFKGFFLTFNYVKKKLTSALRHGCLIFVFKKWRKVNTYFLENFIDFFKSLKKATEFTIVTKPSFPFSKSKLKKKKIFFHLKKVKKKKKKVLKGV